MADELARRTPGEESRRGANAEISTGLVRLLRDYTGRGPTKARTYITDNLVTCIFEDTLTKGERVLAEYQGHEPVLEHRKAFQRAMSRDARSLVEQVTGRRVVAFMSDNHIDPDMAIETFVLEQFPKPDTSDGVEPAGGRAERSA
jgi:uncharacterized protein YbcI